MVTVFDAQRLPAGPGGTNVLAAPIDLETKPRSVGPFAMITHHRAPAISAGELPVDTDVRPHPHIGLAAITYVLEGAVTHRDSLGHRCEITAGEIGVTVAGGGVVHSERFERIRLLGGGLDMFQVLLALPDGFEDVAPSFFRLAHAEIPTASSAGATVRLLLSAPPEVPAGLPGTTPILLADVALDAAASWRLPDVQERALYVWSGEIEVSGAHVRAGQVVLVEPGDTVAHASAASRLLAFGGTTVGPRYSWWNYIHSSLERIETAKNEWRRGRVKLPVGDTESFTPAPPDDGRPLRHLNAR